MSFNSERISVAVSGHKHRDSFPALHVPSFLLSFVRPFLPLLPIRSPAASIHWLAAILFTPAREPATVQQARAAADQLSEFSLPSDFLLSHFRSTFMLLANNWETLWADKPYEEDSEEYSQATAFRGIALALPEQAIISPTRIDGTSLPLFKCVAVPIGLILSLCVLWGRAG